MAVQFAYGAKSTFENLVKSNKIIDDAVYFINDAQEIYKGKELVARTGIRFVTELPEPVEADTIYVVSTEDPETHVLRTDIYTSDGTTTVNVTDPNGKLDIPALCNNIPKLTLSDFVEDVTLDDIVNRDEDFVTVGALKKVLDWNMLEDITEE